MFNRLSVYRRVAVGANRGFTHLQIETDSSIIYDIFTKDDVPPWRLWIIIQHIKALLQRLHTISYTVIENVIRQPVGLPMMLELVVYHYSGGQLSH